MRRTPNVIAGNDDDPFAKNAIEQLVGETPQQVTPSVSPMNPVCQRRASHRIFRSL
jgi:hypothetical protein